jgi:transposase
MFVYTSGPAGFIAALYDQLGFGKIIDDLLPWDPAQCLMSPGTRIKAMVINIFCGRRPLYRVNEFYSGMDTGNLFGLGITPEDLSDYNLARALDKLHQAGEEKVFSTLSMHAICQEKIPITFIHSDTTSRSFYGEYEEDDDELDITKGYSKDRRPDLNQVIVGLGVTGDKIPILADVENGNTDDKTWNFKFMAKLSKVLSPELLQEVIYVADSAMITENNLEQAAKNSLRFISRFPGNFSLEKELKAKAWQQDNWEPLGSFSDAKKAATYKSQPFIEELDGRKYRFIVVHSSVLDGRKARSLEKKLSETRRLQEKAIKEAEKQCYACLPDAQQALSEFLHKHRDPFSPVQGQVVTEEKRKPGRQPKNGVPNTVTSYRLQFEILTDDEAIVKEKERQSCFVLITNLLDQYSDREILKEYKQQINVETSFKFIKDPLYVGAVYLKKKGRVKALSYVILIALLLFHLMERRVREAMKQETEPLLIPGKKKTFKPTGEKILQSLENMIVMTTPDPLRREFPRNLKVPERLFHLANINPGVYLQVRGDP